MSFRHRCRDMVVLLIGHPWGRGRSFGVARVFHPLAPSRLGSHVLATRNRRSDADRDRNHGVCLGVAGPRQPRGGRPEDGCVQGPRAVAGGRGRDGVPDLGIPLQARPGRTASLVPLDTLSGVDARRRLSA